MSTVSVGLEGVKRAYRRERDPKLKERMRMVIGILEGFSSYEVADRLIVPRPNVSYWKRRFEKEGLEGLRDRPRSGRPPKVKRWKMERVRRMVEGKGYWTAKEVMRLVREETGAEYSLMHVTRILHGWGFSRKKAGKRHVNAASRRQVKRFKKGP